MALSIQFRSYVDSIPSSSKGKTDLDLARTVRMLKRTTSVGSASMKELALRWKIADSEFATLEEVYNVGIAHFSDCCSFSGSCRWTLASTSRSNTHTVV